MFLNDSELQAIWLTMRLAGIVTLILLLVGTPIASWKGRIAAVVGLPLVAATFGTQPLVNSRATTIQPCPWCRLEWAHRRCWHG